MNSGWNCPIATALRTGEHIDQLLRVIEKLYRRVLSAASTYISCCNRVPGNQSNAIFMESCPVTPEKDPVVQYIVLCHYKMDNLFPNSHNRHPMASQGATDVFCETKVLLTLNVRGSSYLGLPGLISWLLMPWLLTSPGHQQPRYWFYRITRSFSCWRKDSLCSLRKI